MLSAKSTAINCVILLFILHLPVQNRMITRVIAGDKVVYQTADTFNSFFAPHFFDR